MVYAWAKQFSLMPFRGFEVKAPNYRKDWHTTPYNVFLPEKIYEDENREPSSR
jgi:hypothetical protein